MKVCPPFAVKEIERIGSSAVDARTPRLAIFVCFVVAGTVVALDLIVSSRFGLLLYPPMQDGVTYMAGAKLLYCTVLHSMGEPSALGALAFNWPLLHAPLWVALMSATFFVFGEGEWQSHLVRIWPVFLLLLLMFWFVRRRWNSSVAWFAVAITAFLPTAVPALAACARGSGREASFEICWLGDLRPDFLAAILVVWAAALVSDNVDSFRRSYFICSGIAFGLACLTKPSAMPAFVMVWGLVWVYFFALNVRHLKRAAVFCTLSVSIATAILFPYLALGGYGHVKAYVWDAVVTNKALWSVASSPLADFTYYWVWFDRHLWISGWLLLITGLGAAAVAMYKRDPIDRAALGYLAIAAAWYLLVAMTKAKNPFLGLPFYLFLCLFSWSAIAAARRRLPSKTSEVLCLAALSLGSLVMAAGTGSFLAWNHNEPLPPIGRNKEVLRQIALDMRAYLKAGETFSAGDWWTYTGGDVPSYSIDEDGLMYPEVWPPYQRPDQIDEFINDRVAKTKAAVLWKEDMAEVSKRVMSSSRPEAYEYYRALHRWVNRPESPYLLVKEYTLYFADHDTLTLQLYARAP